MQKLRIKIIGKKLHDIGYRIPLINKALSLGVDNFNTFNAELDGTQAVIAIIEADDEIIEEFKDFINTSHPEKAIIEKVLFEEYKNNVPPIERVLQSFQMEQWGKGIPILLKISETLDKNTIILKENTSVLKENTSILKENTSILKEFKNETNDNFNDMKTIMSKHDADASERILSIKREIIDIKDRLSNVEVAVSGI
jgi:acylphosphatase